jgi:hypothetical protein
MQGESGPTRLPWIDAWLGKGYVHAWFSWIEWITLTAALIAVCDRYWKNTHILPDMAFWPVAAIAGFSVVLIFLSGIAGFSSYILTASKARRWPRPLQWILILTGAVLIPVSMAIVLVPIIVGIVGGS